MNKPACRVVTTSMVAGLLVLGCGSKNEAAQPKGTPAVDASVQPAAQPDEGPKVEFKGTLRGNVRLAAGTVLPLASLPVQGKTDTAIAPGCPPIAEPDRHQVSENAETHGLSPLHVAITGMTAAPKRAPVTHELEIRDCRLTPGMIAAMTGDTLRITNKSQAPFLPLMPRESFMQALLPGASREAPIAGIGPMVIKCGFGAYCGESQLLSASHPLYAITDAEGNFTITGVPLDQDLTVHAWHPLFTPVSANFKLTGAERSKDVELRIQPLAAPEQAPAESAPAKSTPAKTTPKKAAPKQP